MDSTRQTGIQINTITREFLHNGQKLPDPDPSLTEQQVKQVYAATYPKLGSAAVEGPEIVNGVARYTFITQAGPKG